MRKGESGELGEQHNTVINCHFYRWEVVAEYINQHTATNITRQAKEVLNKAKELQHSDQHMREAANKNAYHSMEKAQARQVISDATASQRYDSKFFPSHVCASVIGISANIYSSSSSSV